MSQGLYNTVHEACVSKINQSTKALRDERRIQDIKDAITRKLNELPM